MNARNERRRIVKPGIWLAMSPLACATAAAASGSGFDVGDRAQLFIDRVLVRSARNVAFTLHPAEKHPLNPLIKADSPLDGWRLALCGSALYDAEEALFKLWYLGGAGAVYATSKDGIRWDKHDTSWRSFMFVSVMKDAADPDPARRYKIIAWCKSAPGVRNPAYKQPMQHGYNVCVSPDGRQVTLMSRKLICAGGDVISAYYDRRLARYVAFPKIMTPLRGFNQRCFAVTTSTDLVEWTEPKLVFVPDLRDNAGTLARLEEVRPLLDVPDNPRKMRTEFYGIGAYQQESCTIAFPWMLTINNNARYGNHEGPGEIQLAVSRDLAHWDRPFREPCVPRGALGEWDCGFFETANEALRVGDEVWLYYSGANYLHGTPCLYREEGTGRGTKYTGSIGLAKWKLDRFVSVDGPAAGGVLTTVPIAFKGARLELNAATRADGEIVVELLDVQGQGLARSTPFAGDELRHTVAWTGEVDLAALAATPAVLRFHLRDASLFSFAFRQ